MLILITVLLLVLTALVLVILRIIQPKFRFFWLSAVGGTFLAWISSWVWLVNLPIRLELPIWQPASLFADSPSFIGDGTSWPFVVSLTSIALAVLLTEVVRAELTNPLPWAGILTLTGLGVLAVTANNPLSLVVVWAALDMAELITLLRAVDDPQGSERAVIAFSIRVIGIGLVLWANFLSLAQGTRLDFVSMAPPAGLFLLLAAGLRLGVLPLHLPFSSDSVSRRGVGTSLRLISAASSLILLARIAPSAISSPLTPVLLIIAGATALYTAWVWLRAPDDLSGRPFWVISLAALAMASSLRANPTGATAWGCALMLAGGALFLISVQNIWLNRSLMIAAFAVSGLPFSLTASGWESSTGTFFLAWPLLLAAQGLLMAGYVRHALRPGSRENQEALPFWARSVYPSGTGLLLITCLLLGFFGWEGARRLGAWVPALITSILAILLVWLTPRLRVLNPIRAHWVRPTGNPWLTSLARQLWNLYQGLGHLSRVIANTLEGEGSIMWTLLFLALFISLMLKGNP
jgi:hypothetical protein